MDNDMMEQLEYDNLNQAELATTTRSTVASTASSTNFVAESRAEAKDSTTSS